MIKYKNLKNEDINLEDLNNICEECKKEEESV